MTSRKRITEEQPCFACDGVGEIHGYQCQVCYGDGYWEGEQDEEIALEEEELYDFWNDNN